MRRTAHDAVEEQSGACVYIGERRGIAHGHDVAHHFMRFLFIYGIVYDIIHNVGHSVEFRCQRCEREYRVVIDDGDAEDGSVEVESS